MKIVCGVFAPGASLKGVNPVTRPSKLLLKFLARMAIGWPVDAAISVPVICAKPAIHLHLSKFYAIVI